VALTTYFWGAYPGYDIKAVLPRDDDAVVDCMVRAVAGALPARSSALVVAVDGNAYRVAAGTESLAFDIFGQWAAHLLAQWWRDALLVAVPHLSCTEFARSSSRSRLADATASHLPQELNVAAAPILAFKARIPLAASHDHIAMQRELKCAVQTLTGQTVVLVSDVCVSGADIIACAHFLRNLGAEVGLGLCLAKLVQAQHPSPLRVAPEDIENQRTSSPHE
jgi:hypothetical protein